MKDFLKSIGKKEKNEKNEKKQNIASGILRIITSKLLVFGEKIFLSFKKFFFFQQAYSSQPPSDS